MRVFKGIFIRNSVVDFDEDFFKVGEVILGRLEYVYETVDEQVFYFVDQEIVLFFRRVLVSIFFVKFLYRGFIEFLDILGSRDLNLGQFREGS